MPFNPVFKYTVKQKQMVKQSTAIVGVSMGEISHLFSRAQAEEKM